MTTDATPTIDATDADGFEPIGTATYSVEDNKLRLSAFRRLDAETYERVKKAGFKWAPKQEIFVAPAWTPSREDLLLELCGEIDDEDYSATERAADRAERFGGYRDKRAAEAGASADKFDSGPSAFGHQSRARAERLARRHDRHRTYAVSQWSKAEYWQSRTAGVIANALHKADPRTRRGRIKVLEAEQRKHEKERAEYAERFAKWSEVLTLDGADTPGEYESTADRCGFKPESITPALRLAYNLANYGSYGDYTHPRTGRVSSLYSLLTDAADPITPAEAATLWLRNATDPADETSYSARWSRHYENRLTYERAMLANEGGTAAEAEMVPGGWIGKNQIHGVTRSPVTKKIVSVKIMARSGWNGDGPLKLKSFNIERLPEGAYRAPTPEELEAFQCMTAQAKAEKKATTPKAPSLINPTDADAEKLQAIWNEQARKRKPDAKPSEVLRLTQKEYSDRSKGDYSVCKTADVGERLHVRSTTGMMIDRGDRVTVFKVRTASPGGFTYGPQRVVILTDKPQKPLPWIEVQVERSKQPTEAKLSGRFDELAGVLSANWIPEQGSGERKLIDDAVYMGWAYCSSASQFGFTEAGLAAYKTWQAEQQQHADNPADYEPELSLSSI